MRTGSLTSFTAVAIPSVRSAAHAEAEEQARTRGYTAGYAEGARRAEAELAARRTELEAEFDAETRHLRARADRQVEALQTVLAAVDSRLVPVVANAQDSLAHAAFSLAETIIGTELSDAATSARSVIARVIAQVPTDATTTVRVNPDELPLIADLLDDTAAIRLTADATLNRGDAVATLPDGYIDGRIAAALTRARAELLEVDG